MSIIATAVRHLMAAGVTGEALIEAIAEMEAAQPKDAAAEKRRAYDRERKARLRDEAKSGGSPVESAANADAPAPSPFPNENKSNPNPHPHPEQTPARVRADNFPCPEWCKPEVWRDLKANRKTKRLTNTATAHKQFVAAIEGMADENWPPGKLVEAIAANGWGGPHDPRDDRKPTNGYRNSKSSSTATDAERAIQTLGG